MNIKKVNTNKLGRYELGQCLEYIYRQDPRLKPNSDLHDYQLTYPPTILIEKDKHALQPSLDDYTDSAIGNLKSAVLRFHFGFCQYRCHYCHHYEIKTSCTDTMMESYVEHMIQEMQLFRERAPQLKKLIYFLGGGAPTALPTYLLRRFLDALELCFSKPNTIFSTVEVKPVTASDEKLIMLRHAGFSRISLGIQTLDPKLYQYHHHREEISVAIEAIDRARHCGFDYINIDILTGLEKQTPESWDITLEGINKLIQEKKIDSVAIYPYHDDPRSNTFGRTGSLPSALEVAHSEALARKMFEGFGWKELGTRFFRSSRHRNKEAIDFLKTRVRSRYGETVYHGFGNSALSIGDKANYINHRELADYNRQLDSNEMGISHWVVLDDKQRVTRDLTFDILYGPVVRVRYLQKKYGRKNMATHIQNLNRWTEIGLGSWNRLLGTWRLTKLGKLVHQQMITALYLEKDRQYFQLAMNDRLIVGKNYGGY